MQPFLMILLFAAISLLSSMKAIVQSFGAKRYTVNTADSLLFMGMFFCFTALIFLPSVIASPPPAAVLLYAVVAAVLNLTFQVSYTLALARGPVGITTLFASLAILIPVLGSVVFFDEKMGVLRIVGLSLTVITFLLNAESKKEDAKPSADRSWPFLVGLTFLANGLASLFQKWFARGPHGKEIAGYGFFNYTVGAVIAFAIVLLMSRQREHRPTMRVKSPALGWAAAVGLVLGAFQWLYTYGLRVVDATLLMPVYSGISIMLSLVAGAIFFGERPSRRRLLGVAVGIAAVVLFGIS